MTASTSQTAVYQCLYCNGEMPGPAMTEQPARDGRGKEWRPAGPVPGQCEEHDGVHHPECCQAAAARHAAQQAAEQARAREADGKPWWKTPPLRAGSREPGRDLPGPVQDPPGISRSAGSAAFISGFYCGFAGSGYQGITAGLDAAVVAAAEALAAAYGPPVGIRFNTDRESGGAFLRTPDGRDAGIGICADLVTARRREDTARAAEESETMARTGVCPWGGEATDRQRRGAKECARYDREWLDANPEGKLTIYAHLERAAVPASLHDELAALPGWSPMGHAPARAYHHGPADDVAAALDRCLRFAPPGTVPAARCRQRTSQDDESGEKNR